MENIFLAVVTDNREYGRALGLGMLSVCRNLIIKLFRAEEFFKEKRNFDLVLWDGEEARSSYGGKIVYLAEKSSDAIKNFIGNKFCIYKYSAADHIVASIFEIYEAVTGRRAVGLRRQNVRLFGVASCTGGVGCTTLTMSLGQELCRFQGKKVLYLSFEEVESTGNFVTYHGGMKGAGIYLYHLFKDFERRKKLSDKKGEGMPFLDGYMIKDDFGMESFAPTQGRNPLRELNAEELYRFVSSLIDSGRFDVILMDLGSWLSKVGMECIQMAEKLCLVTSCKDSGVREEQYVSHLIGHCGEDVLHKIVKVRNMLSEEKSERTLREEESSMVEKHMDISRCPNIMREGKVRKIMLEGTFGNEISHLAVKMTEPA